MSTGSSLHFIALPQQKLHMVTSSGNAQESTIEPSSKLSNAQTQMIDAKEVQPGLLASLCNLMRMVQLWQISLDIELASDLFV